MYDLKYRACFDVIEATTSREKSIKYFMSSFSIISVNVIVSLSRYISMKDPLVSETDFGTSIFHFLGVKMLSVVLNGDFNSIFINNLNETAISAYQKSEWGLFNYFNATTTNYTLNYPFLTNLETTKAITQSSSGFFTSTLNISIAAVVVVIFVSLVYFFGSRLVQSNKTKKYSDIENGLEVYDGNSPSEINLEPTKSPLKRSNGIRMTPSMDSIVLKPLLKDEKTLDIGAADRTNLTHSTPLRNILVDKDKPNINAKSSTFGSNSKVAVVDDITGDDVIDQASKDFVHFKSIKTGRSYRIKKKKHDMSDKVIKDNPAALLSSESHSSHTNTADLSITLGELDVAFSDGNELQREQNNINNDTSNRKFTSWEENMRAELNKVKQATLRRNGSKRKSHITIKESEQRDDSAADSGELQ